MEEFHIWHTKSLFLYICYSITDFWDGPLMAVHIGLYVAFFLRRPVHDTTFIAKVSFEYRDKGLGELIKIMYTQKRYMKFMILL